MSSYVSSVSYHLPALESSFVKSLGGITALSLSVIACTALSCRVSFVSVLNIDARPLFAFALGTSLVAGLFFAR
ncbi:MAG: hypothetical protein K0U13_01350, partial [Chlamydiae bacterium]|nr:hypothetical protein [Chlamydiota bacterium]